MYICIMFVSMYVCLYVYPLYIRLYCLLSLKENKEVKNSRENTFQSVCHQARTKNPQNLRNNAFSCMG